jgi:glycosyltransferase involved in cell wall biosynthesis
MAVTITALVTNDFYRDPRVYKTAHSLSAAGHDVTVVSIVDAEPGEERAGPIAVVHLENRYGRTIAGALRAVSSIFSQPLAQGSTEGECLVPPAHPVDDVLSQGWRYRAADCLEFAFLAYRNIRWALSLRARRSEIYYANDLDTLLCAYLLSRLHRSRLIYDSHELYVECIEGSKQTLRSLLRRFEGSLIRRCDAVFTVNRSIAEELSHRYQIATPSAIYNCPTRTADIVHDTAEVAGRPVRIIYQGIYAADRGLEEIVLSQKDLQHCELYLRILFSNPSDEEGLARLIERENLSGSVRIIPPVAMKDLVRGLSGYDIGIIAYKPACLNNYYATPNKLFEYMMGGLALASSDLPEIRNVITRCENGILFEPSDPHDIAMKLQELIADTQRLESMKERSRYYSETVFTWENQEQAILDAIKRVGQN